MLTCNPSRRPTELSQLKLGLMTNGLPFTGIVVSTVDFFPKQQLNCEYSNLKSSTGPVVMIFFLFPSVYGPCFLVTHGTAVLYVYHQNGEYFTKLWSSVRRAVESAHKFYSVRFYIDVGTFELSFIRF